MLANIALRLVTLPCALVGSAAVVSAQSGASPTPLPKWVEADKLDGTVANARFGYEVGVSGDLAVVSSTESSPTGRTVVFERTANGWVVQDTLLAGGTANRPAISGTTIVIPKTGDLVPTGLLSASLETQVFVREAHAWVLQDQLLPDDVSALDNWGEVAAIDGDVVVVGARRSHHLQPNNGACASGSAHVFVRNGAAWSEEQVLLASDAQCLDYFGWSVDVAGDTAVVGALFGDGAAADSGSAYVFTRSGTAWVETLELTATNGKTYDRFGWDVAIDGDVIVVAMPGESLASKPSGAIGRAFVYEKVGGAWTEVASLTASDGTLVDKFAESVEVHGDTVLVGAPGRVVGGEIVGGVYVFEKSGAAWGETGVLTPSDPTNFATFGGALAMDSRAIFVASMGANGGDGAAYVFHLLQAQSAFRNGGTNPASYQADPPVLGQTWSATVDVGSTGHSHALILGTTTPTSALLPGGQTLLVGGPVVLRLPLTPGPVAGWSLPIPLDPALGGIALATQAVHLFAATPFALSNAQDLVVGYE